MDFKKSLNSGTRKEIGNSKKVAAFILKHHASIQDLFSLLLQERNNDTIISHGFYTLKEIALNHNDLAVEIYNYCKKNLAAFSQWEARENFLRLAISNLKKDKQAEVMVLSMLEDKSAIVQTYASEFLLRYYHSFKPKEFSRIVDRVTRKAIKASVKARIKKLIAELA